MALLFDSFGVRRVDVRIVIFPGFDHGFRPGELSALYGRLNADDVFESCELRANVGATFESEHWEYDISTSRIRIAADSFTSYTDLEKRVRHLTDETQAFFTPQRLPFLIVQQTEAVGIVPNDKGADVGPIVRAKILARRVREHEGGLDLLPGIVHGAGITLTGDTDDYHWHAEAAPTHGDYTNLRLGCELFFPPPEDPPTSEMISERLDTTYRFLSENVLEFAQKVLS
jgi:hypothetical protein